MFHSMIQKKILFVCFILSMTAACSKMSFVEIAQSCAPTSSSARFGVSPGPVILEPVSGTVVPGSVTVKGSCVSGIPVSIQEANGEVSQVECVSKSFEKNLHLSDNDGLKDLIVSQNTAQDGGPVADRLCFSKDSTPPAVSISSGNATQSLNQPVTTISGVCETGLTVVVAGPGLMQPVETSCNNGTFTTTVQTVPGDGVKNITATQVDPVGNQGADIAKYTIDSTAPVIRITSPAANSSTSSQILLGGICETGLRVGIGEPNSPNAAYTNCPDGTFSLNVTLPGPDGVNLIKAFQVDMAGNIGQDTRPFIKDSTAPNVTIALPLAQAYLSPNTTFTGTCETGLSVQLTGSVLSAARTVTCPSGNWTLTTAISAGQGTKNLVATQTDASGNMGQADRPYQVDTVAPVLAFTSPAANSYVGASATIQGTCESGLLVQITGAGLLMPSTATCAAGTFSSDVLISPLDGSKQVTISQTDMAGNTGTASRSFIRDTAAPILTITSPSNGSSIKDTVTLVGTCEAGLTVVFAGSGVASSTSTVCAGNGTYSSNLTTSAGDGAKVIELSETDASGNTATATGTYVKDLTAPTVAITTPAANTEAQTGLTVGGTCEAGLNVRLSGTGVATAVNTTCAAGTFSSSIVFTAGDGPKLVTAAQTDAAGNTGSDDETFVRNNTAPGITITSPAANALIGATFTLQGNCQTGLSVVISGAGIDAGATTTCTAGSYSVDLNATAGDGVKTVIATQTDAIGNVGTATRNFRRDSTAPVLTITSPANGSFISNSATLVGTCEAGLTVSFAGPGVAAPSTALCTVNGTYSSTLMISAGDGTKVIELSETDASGNTATATGTYIKDSTGPLVTITSPAPNTEAQTGLTVGGTCEAGLGVRLSGTGVATVVNTTCASGTFSSSIVFTTGDGPKLVTASQTDAAGNTGSDNETFVRNNAAPAITITSPAANALIGETFTLQGNCQSGLTVVISGAGIDAGTSVPCTAGNYSANLTATAGDGTKNVIATQTDAIGNTGSATRNFRRDTTAPILTITSPANGSLVSSTVTLTGTCEAGLTVVFAGAGVASSTSTVCAANGTYSSNLTTSAGDGTKVIELSETDASGNTATATGTYVKDLTAPLIAITSPAANTEAQTGLTVGGTCEAGLGVRLSGTGVATVVNTTCATGTFSSNIVFTAGDGPKLVTASQTDAAGNTGSDNETFVRNNAAPAITITSPAANALIGAIFTLQGNCQTGLSVVISGAGIDAGAATTCTAGSYSVDLNATAGDGTKTVIATQTDAIGNTGSATRNFRRDTTAPVLTITSPANGSFVSTSVTLVGTCEAGLTIQFSGPGVASSSSAICAANGTYSSSLTTSSGDGTKVINLSESDASGNTATATGTYVKDSTGPVVAITSPAPNTEAQNGLTVGGTCEAGLTVTLSGSGVAAPVTTACSAGSFTGDILFTAGSGPKLVTASQTDAAGNTGSDNETFVRDLTGPAITITSPAANSFVVSLFTLQGNCEGNFTVTLGGPGIMASTTTACVAGSYSVDLATSLVDGVKTVTASQTDAVGNSATATRNFRRDTAAPILTITSPVNGSFVSTSFNLIGACEPGLTVVISGPGLASGTSVVCAANGTYSSNLTTSAGDGTKVINASETDVAGNNATATATYIKDSTAPLVAITSPAANTEAQTGLTVGGTCEAGLTVTLAGSGVSTPVTTACSAGTFTGDILFTAGSGPKLVTASQTDAAGNTGSDSETFIRDLTAPTITITSPAANSYVAQTFVLQGNCESGLPVAIAGSGIGTPGTVLCVAGSYSTSVTTTAGDGVKAATASQTDAVGNSATVSRNFQRDSLAPVLTITSPFNGSFVSSTFTLVGTCEAGLTVVISGPGLASGASVVCASNGTYSSNLTTSAGDGNKVINVSETDVSGNTSTATATYIKDSTGPLVAITSPAANTEAQNGLTVGGTCEAGLTVTLSGSGVATPVTTACSAGTFTGDIVFTAPNGPKLVTASQTDAAGNTGSDSETFIKDTVAPSISITSPAANSYLAATFTLQGNCQNGLSVTIAGAGIATGSTVACSGGAYSASLTTSSGDGVKTVTATQTDLAGNFATATRNFQRDTVGPVLTITSPMANASVPVTSAITGACETGSAVTITGDLAATATGPCSAGAYNINVTFSAGLGTKNVTVSQTDVAGNLGQVSSQFLRNSDSGFETFVSDASFGKIDILFVDDNSASMDPAQNSLGAKFAGFSSELKNIDWQIGITTTDCSNGPYGICGSLLPLTGTSVDILTPTVPNYQTVFNNSIRRPETAGCLNTGTCPAGNSQPLLAATTAMTKQNTDNNGFFRMDSDLAIVILSDADEGQNSPASLSGRPAQLVSTFNTIWPSGKKLSVYSIIVKPGDAACLSQLTAANGGFSFYGNYIDQTVGMTSGLSTSICAPDYTVTLKSIGESVRTLTNSVQLAHTPIAGSVTVTFVPAQSIPFKVIGNKVVFDSPPAVGSQIQVSYSY